MGVGPSILEHAAHKTQRLQGRTLKTMALTSRAVRWRARSDMSRCCSGSMCSSAATAAAAEPPCGVLGMSDGLGLRLLLWQPSEPEAFGAGGVRLAWQDWS